MPRWVKCCSCGKSFNPTTAKEYFNDTTDYWMYDYNKFKQWYCPECANEMIEDKAEDFYYETCEGCGKQFDVMMDAIEFEGDLRVEADEDDIGSYEEAVYEYGILCRDCMLQTFVDDKEAKLQDFLAHPEEYGEDPANIRYEDEDEDDEDDDYDPDMDDEAYAAASTGFDEDYGWKHDPDKLRKHMK